MIDTTPSGTTSANLNYRTTLPDFFAITARMLPHAWNSNNRGQLAATAGTLIETAKFNGIDPQIS